MTEENNVRPPGLEEFIRFNQELEALVRANFPLAEGIRRLSGEMRASRNLREMSDGIARELERGQSLAQAIEKSGSGFPKMYLEMIRVGEKSGSLAASLRTIIHASERELDLRSTLRTMMAYPLVILALAVALIFFLSLTVIPRFSDIYAQLGAELPALTTWVMQLGRLWNLGMGFIFLVGGLVVVALLLRWLHHNFLVMRLFDNELWLRLPILGPLISMHVAEQWSRALSQLLRGGVPLAESLGFMSDTLPNLSVQKVCKDCEANVRRGGRLVDCLDRSPAFSPSFRWILARAEERGDLADALDDLACLAEAKGHFFRQRALVFFEPLLLIAVGCGVGILVIALYLPIFSIPKIIGS